LSSLQLEEDVVYALNTILKGSVVSDDVMKLVISYGADDYNAGQTGIVLE
jgi:hypothetical protein